jgi:putative membrane protein
MGNFSSVVASLQSGLPVLIWQLCIALAIWLLSFALLFWLTPYKSLSTIRDGNIAVALSAGGSALALAIPMAACLAGSVNGWDIILWGLPTVAIQFVAYWATGLILPHLGSRLEHQDIAAAIFLLFIRLGFACINAAAIAV